ncbi:triacylglycerol lipase [Conexibacter sp. DBS9H8]|uniref:esterase/lipase family protein n=1 Tax=Conexibacter sp. DBS9H8 TaxID=2937801 RepID=UPI00200FF0EF|nr:alpha/beta fold hydrolase [Conexibacter sp. DBS9H8]
MSALRDTHRVIAGRVFWALSAAGDPVALATLPVRVLHDSISGLAYGLTGAVGETVARVGAELTALIAAGQQAGLRARVLLGVLNGMFGDRLAREGSPLALRMVARVDAAAPPSPRLAVFIHGLCETDDAWFLWRGRGPLYGERLRVPLGYTPVYVRYNSGQPIANNGAELADLLEELVADAPMTIEEIVLIGHSMGGLVAREALSALSARDSALPVRHLISLGTPHRGARLEVAADAAARVMAWVPETRALADALGLRSAGIQDLRHGAAERCAQDVDHYFFSAGLGRGLEPWLGDLLVHRHSAWDTARGEPVAFAADHYSHLGDATHFDLLGHPVIAEQIVRWLGGTRLLEAGAAQRP